jgi:ketosteroid isomerase-like protein
MSTLSPTDIVRASFDAYANVDRSAFEALMGPGFRFTSPRDYRLDRDGYFARCWPERAPRTPARFVHTAENAGIVFVTYEDAKPDGTRFRDTEVFTVRDGKIVDVCVYFGWDLPADVHQPNDE